MSVLSIAKNISISPRKVGVVADLVRGRTVEEAITILSHTPRRSAITVKKAIESAKANASYNHNFKPDTLRIVSIIVTPGPRSRRYRPAAHGRALPYQLKTSHIRVEVDGEQRQVKKAVPNNKSQSALKTTASKAKEAK